MVRNAYDLSLATEKRCVKKLVFDTRNHVVDL